MFKRILVIAVAVLMLVTSIAGCGSSSANKDAANNETSAVNTSAQATSADNGSTVPKEPGKVIFVLFGDKSKRMSELLDGEINEMFKKEINTTLEIQYVPWGEYGAGKKLDLMLAAGEEFDATLSDHNWANQALAKKTIQDLTDVAEKYLPDLSKVVSKEAFDNFKFDDRLYAIPVGRSPHAGAYYSVRVRQDLLEEVGMSKIESMNDMEKFADLVKAKYPDMYATQGNGADIANHGAVNYMLEGITDKNYTTLYQIPYIYIDEDAEEGKLIASFETEEFKNICNFYERLYKKNLIPKDVLTNKGVDYYQAGKAMWSYGLSGSYTTVDPKLLEIAPNARNQEYFIKPGKPIYQSQYESTAFMVPAYSKNADRVAMVLNLMQKNEENIKLLTYGVEGKDYTMENNKVKRINTDELIGEWMLFNSKIPVWNANQSDELIKVLSTWDDGAITSKQYGWAINMDPIKTEKAKIDAVFSEVMLPMGLGILSYDKGIEKLKKDMKAAGWDKFMTEMQNQFTAYRASVKK